MVIDDATLVANACKAGWEARQGPHQCAEKVTTTAVFDRIKSARAETDGISSRDDIVCVCVGLCVCDLNVIDVGI